MSIEHRWDARIPTDIAVTLQHATLGAVPGGISNVSEGGACLLTGAARLPGRCACHIVATLPEGSFTRIVRLPVLVIWSITGAAGVMFGHLDDAGIEARDALLAYARANLAVTPLPAELVAGYRA